MAERELTAEEARKAREWIVERVGSLQCPVCSSTDLVLGVAFTRLYTDLLNGRGYPAVVAVCPRCAYMATFNAILMGLQEPTDAKETGDE